MKSFYERNKAAEENNEFNERYENKQWYKVIEARFAQKFKIEPTSPECQIDPFSAAQVLLGQPVLKTFAYGVASQRKKVSGNDENY